MLLRPWVRGDRHTAVNIRSEGGMYALTLVAHDQKESLWGSGEGGFVEILPI